MTACKYQRACSFNYCCFGPITSTPPTAWDYFGEIKQNNPFIQY